MKKLILFIGVALIISCAPGKSDITTKIDIYCNSCHMSIKNEWHEKQSNTHVVEQVFDGTVTGYKRIELNRFDSPNSCLRIGSYSPADTCLLFIIENNDTVSTINGLALGYCY